MHPTLASIFVTIVVGVVAAACGVPLEDRLPLAADAGEADAGPDDTEPPRRRRDAGTPLERDAAIVFDAGYASDAGALPPDIVEVDAGGSPPIAPPPTPFAVTAYGITSSRKLVQIDAETGAIGRTTRISGLGDGEQIVGADVRPVNGRLYALTDRARLYEIALDTGVAGAAVQLVADPNDTSSPFSALRGKRFGVDWNPLADRLRVVSDAGDNLRVDPATGATTTDGAINPGPRALTAAAYTQSFGATCRTRLLVIDAGARRLFLQDPPNAGTLTELGGLGDAAFEEVDAFEIQTVDAGTDRGLIAVRNAGQSYLLDVDLRRAAASAPRAVALDADDPLIALTASPQNTTPAQAPGELLGLTASQRLISFNRGAPGKLCTTAEIAGLDDGDRLVGFDVRPSDGMLYGLGSRGSLYTIAVPSGAAKRVATLTADPDDATEPFAMLRGSMFGVGWNPAADRLRVLSDNGQNLRIQAASGATTTDAALSGATSGVTALAYTNAFAGTKTTSLFAIDPSRMAVVRIGGEPATAAACTPVLDPGNPNCGVTSLIGMLGVDAGTAVNGFEIDGKTGVAFVALTIGPATVSTLYAVDLIRGTAALPAGVANATIGGGELLRAITLAKVPAARAFGLTADGRLSTFNLTTPSKPTATVTISGLSTDETLLGIDVRPADGKLYAPSSSGRLYTLDPQSGAASPVSPLAAASGDDLPFAGFGSTAFGIDFNPSADLLRVVDAGARNFRVAPSARGELRTGDVVSDSALTPGRPVITAAAYSDSFAGSSWTTLYAIDSELDALYLIGGTQGTPSPNGGMLTPIGILGVDAVAEAGFDIAGGHNGLAVAAIAGSAGPSVLYSVDLTSGWASPFNASANAIGGDDSAPLVGLAIELK